MKHLIPPMLVLVIALVPSPRLINAQSPNANSVTQIDTYAAGIDRYIKLNKKSHRIFADIASASDDKADWKEFKSEKERQKAETGENLNQNAYVWTRNGKVIGANFTFTSPSGDWVHFIMYYFREDGTLAKIHAQLNTFYGEISVVRDRYYDSGGRLLKSTRRFLDLKTQKPKKPADFMDNEIPIYRNVPALPFRQLL